MDNNLPFITKRYELKNIIGQGGMGIVYRAYDRLTGQDVALKQVTTNAEQLVTHTEADSQGVRTALTQEFRVLASVRHPNIISVLDYSFDTNDQPYFTMELLEGAENVLKACENKSVEEKVHVLIQMLQALAYLHRRGILHRDLKPANIMCVNDQVKLLDFGLARATDVPENDEGGTSGTLAYIAPEVLMGEGVTLAADLYAVGVVGYEMFAGHHPYNTKNIAQLIQEIMYHVPDTMALDIPADLAQILSRLLDKEPIMRYESANEAILELSKALGREAPPETSAIRESFLQAARFVGRHAEYKQLAQALEQGMNGHGKLWLVGGESGVGKSRLIDEVRTYALTQGMVVVRGQATTESSVTYNMWREVLRWISVLVPINPFEASILRPIVPDIETLIGQPVPDAPPIDPRGVVERLFGIIEGIFRRIDQPIMILLEDLHWSGSESMALLQRLHGILASMPVVILGTFRNDETPHLATSLPDADYIKLDRLTTEDIRHLSVSMLGQSGAQPAVVDMLQRETEGNVFFIIEVVRALAEHAGKLEDVGVRTLPGNIFAGGIQTIVERRLSKVPRNIYELLEVAAVAGRVLDVPMLTKALPNMDIATALVICADAAVLDVQDDRWRFAHDKLREFILSNIKEDHMIGLHEQVASAIEATYPNDREKAAILAYHWHQAGDEDMEAQYVGIAGEQELNNGAYANAYKHLNRALELLRKQPQTPERIQQELNIQISLAVLALIQYGQSSSEAKHAYDRAREIANQLGETPQMFQVLFGLWAYYLFSGEFVTAWEIAQQCLGMAQKFNISSMLIESHVAVGNTAFWMGNIQEAAECLDQTVAMYVPAEHDSHLIQFGQDPRITSRVFGSWALWMKGYADQSLAHGYKALEIAESRNHPYSIAMSLQIIAWAYYHHRKPEHIMEYSGRLIALCERENFPTFLVIGLLLNGWALAYNGESEIGVKQLYEARGLWEAIGGGLPTFPSLLIAEALRMAGDNQQALETLNVGINAARSSHELAYESELLRQKALVLLALGQKDEARAMFDEALAIARKQGAKAFELRVLTNLMQKWPDDKLRGQLQTVYDSFTEGLDTTDMKDAKVLLDA